MTTLNDIAQIVDCEHKTAPHSPGGGYFAVGTPAMRGNSINYAEAREIDRPTFDAWTRRLVPRSGDLLFAREAPVGPVVRVPDSENVAPGQRTVLIRPNRDLVNGEYLYSLLRSPRVQRHILLLSAGSTVAHLNVSDVRKLDLGALPLLPIQRAIAEVLGSLDDKIAANQRIRALADELLASFVREIQHSPTRTTLGAQITLNYGKSLPADRREPGSVKVVGSSGIVGTHNRRLLGGPAVVVGRKGSVGATYWIREASFPIDTTYWVQPNNADALLYLYYLLRSIEFQSMNEDSAVPGLNRERAYQIEVADVSTEDLHRFNKRAQPMRALLDSLDHENERLAATRDELLPLLMSGAITVKDAEKRVEEEV